MSDLESIITPVDPSRVANYSTSTSVFSSISRTRRLARAISLFKRESQLTRTEASPDDTDPPAIVNSSNSPSDTPPSSPADHLGPTSLIDIQPYLTPPTPEQKNEGDAIWTSIYYAQSAFKLRVEAPPLSPLNISPNSRAPFEVMVWALLIIDHPTPTNADPSVPSSPIPVIKSLAVNNISAPSTPDTRTEIERLNVYFKRTEILVQLYAMPSNVTSKLAEIATKINGSKFARYMGARGPWSLRRAFGGLQVLLHWWAATSPGLMVDFVNAVSLHSKSVSEFTRKTLRGELGELFDIRRDHEGYEKMLDTEISHGHDEISMFRRQLHTVIQDAFEDLLERAKAAEVDDDSKTLSAGE
jgi:hypothetical protein